MFGIDDPSIYWGYALAVLSLIACVWYGVRNWNRGQETDASEMEKDLAWEDRDELLKEKL